MTQEITLQSKDGVNHIIQRENAMISNMIAKSFEFESTADILTLNIDSHELFRIIEYMDLRNGSGDIQDIKHPLTSSLLLQDINFQLDEVEYIKMYSNVAKKADFLLLINAANYLDIPRLLHLCLAQFAINISRCADENQRKEWL